MECNKDEAARAREIAEMKFAKRDLHGAQRFALKAQSLFPGLEGIGQMVATMNVYLASEVTVHGEKDWYSILSVEPTAGDQVLKKEYMKLILQLHPDKNKSVGSEGAFKMVRDAYEFLSDKAKRAIYDEKRKTVRVPQQTSQSSKASVAPGPGSSNVKARPMTEVATHAVQQHTSRPPPPSVPPPQPAPAPAPSPAHRPDPPPASPITFWTSCKKCKMHYEYHRVYLKQCILCPSCLEPFLAKELLMPPTKTHERGREEAQAAVRTEESLPRNHNPLKRHSGAGDVASSKKMRTLGKGDAGIGFSSVLSGHGSNCPTVPGEPNCKSRLPLLSKTFIPLHCRRILLEKAKGDLKSKLEVSQLAASEKGSKQKHVVKQNGGDDETLAETDRTNAEIDEPLSYNVPDADFHDFDKDRTEESIQSGQIWATYDDEDGMPRYYALIREVRSLKPFRLSISFLTSRTNSEFGPSNWVSAGFTKTCGDFWVGKSENSDILNMFSHQIKCEKGQRRVIKIYPQKGDIWAVYRNWSPDWDDYTPDNVVHAYDVLEVLDNYDEEHGISVVPLVKVAGFRTVFQRHLDPNAAKKIPREEMFRFSHQVPVYKMSGEEAPNIPKDSYELDPAAISIELLQGITETAIEANGTSEC